VCDVGQQRQREEAVRVDEMSKVELSEVVEAAYGHMIDA
jgi:hypothetical protein